MLLTVEQIKQLYTLLQEYPTATHVSLLDVDNQSGIGADTVANFIAWPSRTRADTIGSVDITDTGAW